MDKKEKNLTKSLFNMSLNVCIMDIETTGLSKYKDNIICIGVIYCHKEDFKLIQWFADTPDEEATLLLKFLSFVQNFDAVYTYGGNKFDIPFLTYRLSYHNLNGSLSNKLNFIDISKFNLLRYKSKRGFEECISYKRNVSLAGREITKLYQAYQKSNHSNYKELILTHNLDELMLVLCGVQIYMLFSSLKDKVLEIYTDYLETMTQYKLILDSPAICSYHFAKDNIAVLLEKDKNECIITVTPTRLSLKKHLHPIKDYFYIPSQNKLIHKSIASFISKDLKEKATKDNCFILKKDYFIKAYDKKRNDHNVWHDDNNNPYILFDDFVKNNNIIDYIMYFCHIKNSNQI